MSGTAAGQRINEILATPTPLSSPAKQQHEPMGDAHTLAHGIIRFAHVDYAYDGQRPALYDVSFAITPGQKIALVGPSGAGKVRLLISCYASSRRIAERSASTEHLSTRFHTRNGANRSPGCPNIPTYFTRR